MNPQQEAVALWRYIESRGQKPTFRLIASVLRSWGLKFRDGDLLTWLSPFRATAGKHAETSGQQKTITLATSGQHPETSGLLLRAQNNVSLDQAAVLSGDSLRSSPSAQPAVSAQPSRKPKALGLPLDAQVQIAKSAILEAVWPLLAPALSRSTSKTSWKAKNANVARELAALGRTPDEIVAAWHSASDRLGSPCRTLRIVQDELAKIDSGLTGTDCGCGLGKPECQRLHRGNSSTDLLPSIADLEAACNP